MATDCDKKVVVGFSQFLKDTKGDGSVTRPCGSMYAGETVLCDFHQRQANTQFPQGWRGYPGDTCPHGVYTGGCMEDFMCGRCEMGED